MGRKEIKYLRIYEGQIVECPKCHSLRIKKAGKRYNMYSTNQRFRCKECGYEFSLGTNFKRMRYPKDIVLLALKRVTEGTSYRKITEEIEDKFNMRIAHQTVLAWDIKFENHVTMNYKKKLYIIIDNLIKENRLILKRKELNKLLMISPNFHVRKGLAYKYGLIKPLGNGFYKVNKENL